MMGVKRDTKAFSAAAQNEIRKPEGVNNLSANDLKKLGDDSVGDLLNRVADPNWVDPSKKMRAVGSDKMDKDAFMKLMLAQMKNQDPTNPLKSHEMAAQLAQFSQLEQLQNVNTTLEQMKSQQKPTETYQSLNFIGKSVAGDSAKLFRSKGDVTHDFVFNLPEDATDVAIKVRNDKGDYVRTVKLQNLSAGENRWTWNGKNERDMTQPVGEYQFVVEAKTANEKKLNVKTDFSGVITGVSYSSEGPVLLVGNQSVKLKDVRKIVDPSLNQKDQKAGLEMKPDLRNAAAAVQTEEKGAEEVPLETQASIMDQVGLSREMQQRLEKETKPDSASAGPNPLPTMNR